ncbi:MAG: glycoside hydrolase family 5 protein, partial [Treponema sp.]
MKIKSFSKQFVCVLSSLLLAAALLCFIGCPSDNSTNTGSGETTDNADSGTTTITAGSSKAMAQNMKIGWNLGNTFDAHSSSGKKNEGLASEISWLPDYDGDGDKTDNYTTKANIEGIKAAGFTTIRIPISWHNHITDSSYTIDSSWMARVKQIVDWAYNAELYVIINVHHDNFSTSNMSNYYGYCINSSYKTDSNAYLKAVWKQIATTFNNSYDEHLVFEVLNEPRCVGESCEWWVGSSTTPTATEANAIITEYEQTCLDAIRATGGNNAERFIMVP